MKRPLFRYFSFCLLFICGTLSAARPDKSVLAGSSAESGYDIEKYKLEIDLYQCFVAPYPKSFSAVLTVTVKADSVLDHIKLNALNGSLSIDSLSMSGSNFAHSSDTVVITLDRTYLPGEVFDVRIFYRHKNVTDNGFYASYGTVFTDSPPEGARKWMPCHDRPSDKATWELAAIVKAPAMLVSNGLPVGAPIQTGDSIFYHWKSDDLISTYLICFSSKINFLQHLDYYYPNGSITDSIPVMIYHKPGENISLIDSMIGPMTDFFSNLFGSYPFEKIGFATMNTQFAWGGMENQSIVHLRPNGYTDLDLIAHEHSHQWFGDLITCGTWADIWLNEGFGTYCQNLWVEHHDGFTAYQNSMNSVANYYLSSNPGWPVYQPEWALHTPPVNSLYNVAITYNKGACVLYMLRYTLGDSLFFKILKEYALDAKFRFGNAVTEDFIQKVNMVSGQDMRWFFDQWIFGRNHPVYINTFQIDSLESQNWKVTFILRQTQNNAGLFRMPVELKVQFSDGNDTTVSVMNDAIEQTFGFHFLKKPVNIIFDPGNKIIIKKSLTIYHVETGNDSSDNPLEQNFPNPFKESTRIKYHVFSASVVRITVIDNLGRTVDQLVDHKHSPGQYILEYTNHSLKAGIYQIQMEVGKTRHTRKMVLQD